MSAMGLKRMSGVTRSYRFQRSLSSNGTPARTNSGEVASDSSSSSPTSPITSPSSPLRSGDVILNNEGVKVGWVLDGSRSHSTPLFSPYSRSLPCTPCVQQTYPQYWTIGRVKFGVPLEQVCKNDDIPGPLLVLILKLNKEGPSKKDVFRAPGHQGSMKKLIHFLHNGRLVNIDNFSVYTIASVLKKFLRKLPEGIFGRSGEEELFNMIQLSDTEQQRDLVHRLIVSRPKVTQHLLVLLFGTFRVIANSSGRSNTGMTSEALGVSVAPSFFRSCVAHGKTATMDDVLRFKVATQIMQFMIDNFGVSNLFGRENYEYYARITGRVLRVEEDWIFAYRYPRDSLVAPMAGQEESQSTPALIHIPEGSPVSSPECGAAGGQEGGSGTSLRVTVPENNLRESCTRLSISLEENGLYKSAGLGCSGSICGGGSSSGGGGGGGGDRGGAGPRRSDDLTLEELRQVNHYAESTKSLSFLPQVHERQTERMRTRSEWFLTPQQCGGEREGDTEATEEGYLPVSMAPCPLAPHHTVLYTRHKETLAAARKHGSDECKLLRRSSSKDKERRLVRRSSSKKDKENGQKKRDALRARSSSAEVKGHPLQQTGSASPLQSLPPGMMQHAGSPPLQPLQTQNVIYPPVVTRPLLHQHSHDFLLGSPGRRSGGPGLLRPVGGVDPSPGDPCCSGQQPSGGRSVGRPLTELDCTETDVQTVHVSNTYKPRI